MLIRLLPAILFVAASCGIVTAQTPDPQKTDAGKSAKSSGATETKNLRDMPFSGGIDLQFLIRELASDLDLNVLFDQDSLRRTTHVELKNVTIEDALDYIFMQEGLRFDEAGPKTIRIGSRQRTSIPQMGIGILPISREAGPHLGVDGGVLVDTVRDNSPASKAGLKAGDVIVKMDGVPIKGQLGLFIAINRNKKDDIILEIVRDHRPQTINVTPTVGIKSVL